MHLFKFLFLFPVIAGSSLAFASQADNQTTNQIQPEKIAVSYENAPMASAKAYSAQDRHEHEQKVATAKRAATAEASYKSEAKRLAAEAKTEIKHLILSHWEVPADSNEQKANARIILTPSGLIQSIVISDTPNQAFKDSIEKAIRRSAPFELPENPDARRESQVIYMSFHSK